MEDPRRTLPERYSTAIDSSRLVLSANRISDVDLLISAGWIRDGLGTALYRLAAEFDLVRGEHRQAYDNLRAADQAARVVIEANTGEKLLQATWRMSAAARAEFMARADEEVRAARAAQLQAERAALTAKALILVQLKTLPTARRMMGAFALGEAVRARFEGDSQAALRIAGNALAVWLDPLCHACGGRGFFGMNPRLRTMCNTCHGEGRRQVRLGQTDKTHEFGRRLLVKMDRKADYVTQTMQRYLGKAKARAEGSDASVHELQQRLHQLRSTEAQTD